MKVSLLLSAAIAFMVVLYITPWMIKYLRKLKVVVKDQHKEDKRLIPISGGMVVFFGIFLGVLFVVFVQTFFYQSTNNVIELLAFIISLFVLREYFL